MSRYVAEMSCYVARVDMLRREKYRTHFEGLLIKDFFMSRWGDYENAGFIAILTEDQLIIVIHRQRKFGTRYW
jgi:hypothetical protein